MKRSRDVNLIIILGFFAAAAIFLYWLAWFTSPELVQSRTPGAPDYLIYVSYEQAFPLADAWLALAALIGAVGLWKMRDWGFLFMLLASGSAIFLGLMDLLYDLEHNMFVPFTSEAAVELAIVVLLLTLGTLQTVLLWRKRKSFFQSNR